MISVKVRYYDFHLFFLDEKIYFRNHIEFKKKSNLNLSSKQGSSMTLSHCFLKFTLADNALVNFYQFILARLSYELSLIESLISL